MQVEREPIGLYSRGYLPHIDAGNRLQFVTWRLADALPAQVLEEIRQETLKFPERERNKQNDRRLNEYLDRGFGSCILRDNDVASVVQTSLLFSHGSKYILRAWTIMPNHVHVLINTFPQHSLSSILHSIKSYSAHQIARLLNSNGKIWQQESYDRLIRNDRHLNEVVHYIEWNAVTAGLCDEPAAYCWSSAFPECRNLLEESLRRQ